MENSGITDEACFNCCFSDAPCEGSCAGASGSAITGNIAAHFSLGEYLLKEGEPVNGIYCIQRGTVKISKTIKRGRELILWFTKPREVIGIDSFIGNKTYSFSAKAMEPVTACFIPGTELNELISTKPGFSMQVMKYLCDKTKFIEKRITSIAHKKTKAQFAEILLILLCENKNVCGSETPDYNYSIRDFANTIGTTQNYLYKILSEFSREKIVSVENRKLKIINPAKLSKIALGEVFLA